MTELQIEYFLKVAEYQNISETAAKMYVSQAAISRQIAALEKELDIKLFERKSRGLVLTVSGEIMYDLFSRHRAELAETIKEARKLQNSEVISLNIGILEGIDMDEIYKSIMIFANQNPNLLLNISSANITSLMEGITNGEYDIVFSFYQESLFNKYLKVIPMMKDCIQFYISSTHPLAEKEQLTVNDLIDETFAIPVKNTDNIFKYYDMIFNEACGFVPKKLLCKYNLDSVMSEVLYNNCVAMLYNRTLVAKKEKFRIIDTSVYDYISIIYSKSNTNPLLIKLIKHLENDKIKKGIEDNRSEK